MMNRYSKVGARRKAKVKREGRIEDGGSRIEDGRSRIEMED
jgi:hypothetical protein